MSKSKVILRYSTTNAKAGDTVEVDSKTADRLVENGHAVRAKDAPAELKSSGSK